MGGCEAGIVTRRRQWLKGARIKMEDGKLGEAVRYRDNRPRFTTLRGRRLAQALASRRCISLCETASPARAHAGEQ
jgi:hypothetical protein